MLLCCARSVSTICLFFPFTNSSLTHTTLSIVRPVSLVPTFDPSRLLIDLAGLTRHCSSDHHLGRCQPSFANNAASLSRLPSYLWVAQRLPSFQLSRVLSRSTVRSSTSPPSPIPYLIHAHRRHLPAGSVCLAFPVLSSPEYNSAPPCTSSRERQHQHQHAGGDQVAGTRQCSPSHRVPSPQSPLPACVQLAASSPACL